LPSSPSRREDEAERSQIAAEEISRLASGSVELAERAGKRLDTIVPSIQKTSDLVMEIAAASAECCGKFSSVFSTLSSGSTS